MKNKIIILIALTIFLGLFIFNTAEAAVCGNGWCEDGENCDNCSQDCFCTGADACCIGKECVEETIDEQTKCGYVCNNNGTCDLKDGENWISCAVDCTDDFYAPSALESQDRYLIWGSVEVDKCNGSAFPGGPFTCKDEDGWTCYYSLYQKRSMSCNNKSCSDHCCAVHGASSNNIALCTQITPINYYLESAHNCYFFNLENEIGGCEWDTSSWECCYEYAPKKSNGEYCWKDEHCISGHCVDELDFCCTSENPPVGSADEPCDATGDGAACGRWSCESGDWECIEDDVEQTYSEGTYVGALETIRSVTWTKLSYSGEVPDETDVIFQYKRPNQNSWSEAKELDTSEELAIDISHSKLQLRITLETDSLIKTPEVSEIQVRSTPRLIGEQVEDSFEAMCWPIEVTEEYELRELYEEDNEPVEFDEYEGISKLTVFLTEEFSSFFRENDYTNNEVFVDDMKYCLLVEYY